MGIHVYHTVIINLFRHSPFRCSSVSSDQTESEQPHNNVWYTLVPCEQSCIFIQRFAWFQTLSIPRYEASSNDFGHPVNDSMKKLSGTSLFPERTKTHACTLSPCNLSTGGFSLSFQNNQSLSCNQWVY